MSASSTRASSSSWPQWRAALERAEPVRDALLLGLEQVQGDGAGVVRVEQLLPLSGQLDALLVELTPLGLRRGAQCVELLQDLILYGVPQLGGERDGAVLVLNQFFDELGRHRLPLAWCGRRLRPEQVR